MPNNFYCQSRENLYVNQMLAYVLHQIYTKTMGTLYMIYFI